MPTHKLPNWLLYLLGLYSPSKLALGLQEPHWLTTYRLKARIIRERERVMVAIAWRLPKWVIYWAVVRAAALAAGNHKSPVDVTTIEMLSAIDWPVDPHIKQ